MRDAVSPYVSLHDSWRLRCIWLPPPHEIILIDMVRLLRTTALLICLCCLVGNDAAAQTHEPSATATVQQPKPICDPYIRVKFDSHGEPIALQTCIQRFVAPHTGGLQVDLVGVVHFADANYYRELNRLLQHYDVVLYELIAEEGHAVEDLKRRDDPFRMLRGVLLGTLGLSSQLEQIDYAAANFVHADATPQKMAELLEQRGDNSLTIALAAAADLIRTANIQSREQAPAVENSSGADPLIQFLEDGSPRNLKRAIAMHFHQLGNQDSLLGPTLHRLLVEDRNGVTMQVFQREVAKGHRRVAIFYGAAHLPDFAQRLITDFGLEHESSLWLDAWDLSKEVPVAHALLNGLIDFLSTN